VSCWLIILQDISWDRPSDRKFCVCTLWFCFLPFSEEEIAYTRGLKLKLLRGSHEDFHGNPCAALWRRRNSGGTWT